MPILKKKEPVKVKSSDTVIRITNPTGKPKEVDGLVGDRQQGYGCLRFAPTDHGLYMTTANPFYGTQLYLLKNNKG